MNKDKKVNIEILIIIMVIVIGIVAGYKLVENNVENRENFNGIVDDISSTPVETKSSFSYDELGNMALDYFLKTGDDAVLPRDEYNVGISDNVIPQYQNKNMVVIEIRHINNNINNTLDARYYINIYTAKGYDSLENEIDLNLSK